MKVLSEEEAKRFNVIKAAAEKIKNKKAQKIRTAIEDSRGHPTDIDTAIPRI